MADSFHCPSCQRKFSWKPEMTGRKATCKGCGTKFTVPDLSIEDELPPLSPPLDEFDSLPPSDTPDPASQPTGSTGAALTLRNDAEAENPGLLRMQITKYLQCFWHEVVLAVVVGGVVMGGLIAWSLLRPDGVFGMLGVPLSLVAGAGLTLVVAGWFIYQRREQFWHGAVCPAMVIAQDPYLVAVATDLTKGDGFYPAVKVVKQPLGSMTGGPPQVGQKLATVAVYSDSSEPHWSDFDPIVINCVTRKTEDIDRVLASIPAEEWQMLEIGVAQLPESPRPGRPILLEV